jgi:adenine-specific DNA-methyltransferase
VPTLQFKGKTVIETYHHTVPHHRLELNGDLSVLPKGQKPSLDGNLIIEGDNLLALKALLPTHAGRVKCVYIDPPYNTGNEGWVYNDNLTQPQFKEWIGQTVGKEGEDACRHDKWCCMMYPRLRVLKDLLRDDGCVWISIDDNEVANLRAIMDEVFGPDQFVAQVAVMNNPKGRGLRGGFAKSHEYLLVYAKTKDACIFQKQKSQSQIDREYPEEDKTSRFRWLELRNTHREFGRHNRKNLYYPLYVDPKTGRVTGERARGLIIVEPIWEDGFEGCWTWKLEKVIAHTDDLIAREIKGTWKIFRKGRPTPKKPKTFWKSKAFFTDKGQKTLTSIFGKRVFHAPKPVDYLKEVIEYSTQPGDLILDACAGSGTLGHAILRLNYESQSTRQFVLIQQKHDSKKDEQAALNICESVTAQRMNRVVMGQWASKKRADPPLGGSFTYARVGEPLFDEYKQFAKKMPAWEDLAKYVFYTETSQQVELKKLDAKSGFVGATEAAGGTSYFLFYTPDRAASEPVGTKKLKELLKRDKRKNWVIYCEKIWIHQDELRQFEREHDKRIRLMQAPFQLK